MARIQVEIKVRCTDLDATRTRARGLVTQWSGLDRQVDTYFRTARGRLKLRESSLSGGQLVPYLRPDAQGPRRSEFLVVSVEEPEALRELLSALLGVHVVVRKEREIARVDDVRLHLDRVEGLGDFVELEAPCAGGTEAEAACARRVEGILRALGLGDAERIAGSYETLLSEPAPGALRGK